MKVDEIIHLINKIGEEIIKFKTKYDVSKMLSEGEETIYLLLNKLSSEAKFPFDISGVVRNILEPIITLAEDLDSLKYELEDILQDIEVAED